jgi:hypothetical protein
VGYDFAGYHCAWLGPTSWGGAEDYSTYRSNTTPSLTTWKAATNQLTVLTKDLGVSSMDLVKGGGEFNGLPNIGTAYGCYGCNGLMAFQRATAPGGSNWYTIQGGTVQNTDFCWRVSAVPSPFYVNHPNNSC